MKSVILLGDGMADRPLPALRGKTPLQAARIPNMDSLARMGSSGLAATVPEGMAPGSDVANLSVLGYDPHRYYTGRAPLEAAAMGVELGPMDVAFRCNLVYVSSGRMVDYSAGHISSEEGRPLIASLKDVVPGGRIYPGVSYRNLLVLQSGASCRCTPPHDISGHVIEPFLPSGEGADLLRDIMERSVPVLADHPVNLRRVAEGKRPANMIWLWGQGYSPRMPTLRERFGLEGAMISAVDLLRGIGRYAGMRVIEVPGATGTIDTNYRGKVEACLRALEDVDLVYLHVEAPDEAAHEGDVEAKIKAIELFDSEVVGPVMDMLNRSPWPWRILVLPDHPTPIEIRTHSPDPVPFTLAGVGVEPDAVQEFSEATASRGRWGLRQATELISILIGS